MLSDASTKGSKVLTLPTIMLIASEIIFFEVKNSLNIALKHVYNFFKTINGPHRTFYVLDLLVLSHYTSSCLSC